MKLTKINYVSAVFIGASALVMYFILGVFQLILVSQDPTLVALMGSVSNLQVLVYTPLIGGVVAYVFTLVMILVYNVVAKKFPISWNIKK
mgnify:FL=1|jgi:hypothetical protein|tara:strand:- start:298 stop:567 length:270 start_codon:yes stop_codon:yes gene_type:complete